MENQFNFSQLDTPCELKLGVEDWVNLTDSNELKRFKCEVKDFIQNALKKCWKFKKDIKGMDDEDVYKYLKNL